MMSSPGQINQRLLTIDGWVNDCYYAAACRSLPIM